MLETVRSYAMERLVEAGEATRARRGHLDWALALAKEAAPHVGGTAQQGSWMERLSADLDNLRAACDTALEDNVDPALALRLTAMLGRFWEVCGLWSEGAARCEQALARSAPADAGPGEGGSRAAAPDAVARDRARVFTWVGNLAYRLGQYARATEAHEAALAIQRARGRTIGVGRALGNLGLVAWRQGDLQRARSLHEEGLASFRACGDRQGIANSLTNLAVVARARGQPAEARRLLEESLQLRRELGDLGRSGVVLSNLGNVLVDLGERAAARAAYGEALRIAIAAGERTLIAAARQNLGALAWAQGNVEEAARQIAAALVIAFELGGRGCLHDALLAHAGVLAGRGTDPERAACLLGACDAMREAAGRALGPQEQQSLREYVTQLGDALGAEAVAGGRARGRTLSLEEVRRLALE